MHFFCVAETERHPGQSFVKVIDKNDFSFSLVF